MIHQLIFAYPKPGMSEEEFHRYWLDVHAVQYASKIPQIRRYMVDTRVSLDEHEAPLWSGIAEIWLANEADQLASLQTDEFLNGARLDEPKWAAFWRTVVLDTDAHILREPPAHTGTGPGVKLVRLVKRKEGLPLADFRDLSLGAHARLLGQVPRLRGLIVGHTRDGAYGIGEAVLDGAYQLYFDSVDELNAAVASPEFRRAEQQMLTFVEQRYVHELAVVEHWIIGPESR
jgi:uncharacterized protein (TIGR02118 family)